ncbi:MAG TPA: tetratricopeptide repeat protein [Rhodocyclaceae bacterium]|nr:tetratricopeptide repeat protein [Rhodocyclaceae bacterium]
MYGIHARILSIAIYCWAGWVGAAPYLPQDPNQVLERLPTRPTDPAIGGLRELRRQLAADPQRLDLAVDVAERYFRLAVRAGDPRYIGYAQAALKPWWRQAEPPTDILVLRAGLTQYLHDFDGALADLTRAIARDPGNPTAWSYRAVIHIVMARYDEARHDCRQLAAVAAGPIGAACEPTVDALSGNAAAAYAKLERIVRRYPHADPSQRLWVLTRMAEIAQRLGRMQEAETHYRSALQLGIDDQYLLTAYAEFLLDLKRPAEVVDMLKGKTRNDVLLLRLALAEQSLGLPEAKTHRAAIQSRIDAARQRQDKLHLSDEAIFELRFRNNPQDALRLARENWELGQREPSDARILMEAALAARQPQGAAAALTWLNGNRHEDAILRRLAAQLLALQALPERQP